MYYTPVSIVWLNTVLGRVKLTFLRSTAVSGTEIGCNDDFCGDGLQSTVQFTADAGAVYKIQVGGFDCETGNLAVHVECQVLNCDPVVVNGPRQRRAA